MIDVFEATTTPRVDGCIGAVMKLHPGHSPAAVAKYFEAVHQELAPLARQMECELIALREQLQSQTTVKSFPTRS